MTALPTSDYKIELRRFPDLGLIVKARTGVVYTNQCSGLLCTQCEAEGFFVPLQSRAGWRGLDVLENLFDAFGGELRPKKADQLDRVLRRLGLNAIRSDRSRLEESMEAWVHVIVSGEHALGLPFQSRARDAFEAVLTWPNRD
jgi:hypothetical protein